ncbi:unnamed protein product, partial [Musa acuminata var. zebrina]
TTRTITRATTVTITIPLRGIDKPLNTPCHPRTLNHNLHSTPHVILEHSITTSIPIEGNVILCVLYCSYRYKYSHRFPPRRACNRNSSSWKGVLPYRCLQMGKVVKEGRGVRTQGMRSIQVVLTALPRSRFTKEM